MQAQSPIKPTMRNSGAAALAIVGFTWATESPASKATELVRQRVQSGLVEALTRVRVDKFGRASDAAARLLGLKKVASS